MALNEDLGRILAKVAALGGTTAVPDLQALATQRAAQRSGRTVLANRRRAPAPKLGGIGSVLAQQGPRIYNRSLPMKPYLGPNAATMQPF